MKTIKEHILLFLILVGIPCLLNAQFRSGNYWKKTRNEVVVGIGASNFLGELGGRDEIGKDMSPRDLEFSQTKYVLNAGWRYFITKDMAVKGSLYYGVVSGDDKLTKEPFRNGRNLSFKSPIYEFSAIYEYHLVAEKMGRLYKVRGTKGKLAFLVGIYPFVGIGGIYFNPKAHYQGRWVKLQPLGTEGQGIKEGTQPYSRMTYCIPMGLGFRYSLNQQMGLGLELGYRKTGSDYIDDVSTVYADPAILSSNLAKELANRSLPDSPAGSKAGDERGDPKDKDSYMFGVLMLNYKMSAKRGFRRIKSRRSLPSF